MGNIKTIIGPYLLRDATMDEDMKEGTDLLVLSAEGIRSACRLRHPGYLRYRYEITITFSREAGSACEWNKIVEDSWADWFFYGHANNDDPASGKIIPWYLLDLKIFRAKKTNLQPVAENYNKDPVGLRCTFRAYDVRQLIRKAGRKILIGTSETTILKTSDIGIDNHNFCEWCGKKSRELNVCSFSVGKRICLSCYLANPRSAHLDLIEKQKRK